MAQRHLDRSQIEEIIAQYRRGFLELDVQALRGIWDQSSRSVLYIAIELKDPLRTWEAIGSYYSRLPAGIERVIAMTVGDLSIEIFGDTALAYCTFHFEGEVVGQSETRVIDGRNVFVLQRLENAWKVISYHESQRGAHAG